MLTYSNVKKRGYSSSIGGGGGSGSGRSDGGSGSGSERVHAPRLRYFDTSQRILILKWNSATKEACLLFHLWI